MTPAALWIARSVTVSATLGGVPVDVTGTDDGGGEPGCVRVVVRATGKAWAGTMTGEERREVRQAVSRALLLAKRKAG